MTSRIDIIGTNGGDGEHYTALPQCYGDYKKKGTENIYCSACVWSNNCIELTGHLDRMYKYVEKEDYINRYKK